jgi:hypothetical protein
MDLAHTLWTTAGSHGPPCTAAAQTGGHRGVVARSLNQGLWPLRGTRAHWQGQRRERGARGPISGLTCARAAVWWLGDGDEVVVEEKLSDSSAQALREGEKRRGRPPFIGAVKR